MHAPEIAAAEINQAAKIVVAESKPAAQIVYGIRIDRALKDELSITVVCLYEKNELRIVM